MTIKEQIQRGRTWARLHNLARCCNVNPGKYDLRKIAGSPELIKKFEQLCEQTKPGKQLPARY